MDPWTSAVVTGASRGLGRAISHELARHGTQVLMVARDADRLAAAAREVPGASFVAADLADPRAVERVAATAHERLGPVDLLVNGAATLGVARLALLLDTAADEIEAAFRVNTLGAFRLTRALAGPMVLRGAGTVLSISTDAAVHRYPQWGAYGATKAALDHLTATFAAELADTGVRFVSIDPGEMDTDLHHQALPDADRASLRDPAEAARRVLAALADAANGARVEV